MTANAAAFVVAMVFGVMVAELRLSQRNEAGLRARGAVEPPGDVFRAMAVVYPLAFLLMGLEGVLRSGSAPPTVPAGPPGPAWWVAGVLLMLASKALKYWAISNLGDRWTFRVLVLPGTPLVRTGPYRFVDHPNYIAVVGELAAMALMMSAWISGPVMTSVFGAVLLLRLKTETAALRAGRLR